MPERSLEEHTIVVLRQPADSPEFTEEELDVLQERHLAYLDGLRERGILVANGPFAEQDDEMLRGLCIFAVPREQARRAMADDPMVRVRRLEAVVATWLVPPGDVTFRA